MPPVAALVAAHCLLVTLLALNVSRERIVKRVPHGEGPNHELARSIRAHANAVEHLVPIGLLLFAAASVDASPLAIAVLGGASLVARVSLTLGILVKGRFGLRRAGAYGTYAIELGLIGVVVVAIAT